jgi:tRNA(Ile)-lysidine synthetase-like protein
MGPHPAVAAVRGGVRAGLAGLAPGDLVLAACSGGADSLALAAALAHEAPRLGLRGGGVTVDHGLQDGSAARAAQVAALLGRLGLDPVRIATVTVASGPGRGGPEAAARTARYAALEQVAEQTGAAAVLLAHSRDDQAETVLLGLARGSGARALAGMPAQRGRLRRPLLGLSRAALREACQALQLEPWDDPHNFDPSYARARVRHQALPALEAALGPGIAEALARSAAQLSADCAALDAIATAEEWRIHRAGPGPGPGVADAGRPGTAATDPGSADASGAAAGAAGRAGSGPGGTPVPGGGGVATAQPADPAAHAGVGAGAELRAVLDIDGLDGLAAAVRGRVLRSAALAAGCPGGSLSASHVAALDALVTGWHGQRGADLPGGIRVQRRYGKLLFSGAG